MRITGIEQENIAHGTDGKRRRCLVPHIANNDGSDPRPTDPVLAYYCTDEGVMLLCQRSESPVPSWFSLGLGAADLAHFLETAEGAGLRCIERSDRNGNAAQLIERYGVLADD